MSKALNRNPSKRNPARRRKNLSTGAWIAIGLGIGLGVPAVIAGIVAIYGVKKVTDVANDTRIPQTQTQYDEFGRPIPPIVPPVSGGM